MGGRCDRQVPSYHGKTPRCARLVKRQLRFLHLKTRKHQPFFFEVGVQNADRAVIVSHLVLDAEFDRR